MPTETETATRGWPDLVPWPAGTRARCILTAMGMSLRGTVTVKTNEPDLLVLAFDVPAQQILFKRVPETVFDIELRYRGEGAGNRTVLSPREGLAPGSGAATGQPVVNDDARFRTHATRRQRRIDTLSAEGRPIGFTIARVGDRHVDVFDFTGGKSVPGLRMRIG